MVFACYVMGNESLAVQCAEVLLAQGNAVRGVITRDEGIAGWAKKRGIRVITPPASKAESPSLRDRIREDAEPFEWLFSIANLSIIPDDVLALPTKGSVNFHDGPLPRYAGLNAPSWAILNGETEHGISWHLIEGGVDEGDVLESERFALGPSDTSVVANTRCWEAAIESFGRLVPKLVDGSFARSKQDLTQRTYFGRFDRPAGGAVIDWNKPSTEISALVRALDFGPRYTNPLGIAKSFVSSSGPSAEVVLLPEVREGASDVSEAAGTVIAVGDDGSLEVATGKGSLRFARALCREGTLRTPEQLAAIGVVRGAVLASPDADRVKQLTALDAALAKSESFWGPRLTQLVPVELPAIDRSVTRPPSWVRAPLSLPAGTSSDDVVAAAAAWLSRVTGQPIFDVGYRGPSIAASTAPAGGVSETSLVVDVVPLRVDVKEGARFEALRASISSERARIDAKTSHRRDLYARVPGAIRPRWDVVISEVSSIGEASALANAGVTLAYAPSSGEAVLVCDAARIASGEIERMVARLGVLLSAATSAPATEVARLPLLSADERDRMLRQWNATTTELTPRCVHELFERQVDRTPDATAIVFEDRKLTYRELDAKANQLAHHLIAMGVGPEVPVALHVRRGPDLVIGALGIHKAGGAYVPIDPSYPADRIALYLEDSGSKVVVTHAALADALPAGSRATPVRLDTDAPSIGARSDARPSVSVTPSNLAYVIYTSGSTGKPKGVMVEHGNVANFFVGMDPVVPHQPAGTWLAVTSLSFDISVLELFYTLARGFTVVLSSDEDRALVSSASSTNDRAIGFSLFYFASDEGEKNAGKYRLLLEGARFADTHGFEAVWTPERHFGAFGGLYPNPSVASAAVAAITQHVKIRAGSCVLPLHHPARVAEEWGLVDNLSNGRVGISFASGWHPNDFALRPENFANAKQVLLRDVETVRKLWRGETIEFDGPKGKVAVRTLPRPVQKELPIWLTAAGNPDTFAAAARAGAGLLTHLLGQTTDEVKEKVALYRKVWKECGHAGEGHVTLMLHTFVGGDERTVKETAREPMKAYLRTAMNLIAQHAWSFPAFKQHAKEGASFDDNFSSLSAEDAEALLDHAFERYYEGAGLFGTPESAMKMVERCKAIGVDEIGCLIDYGIDSETVLAHLEHLNRLREAAQPRAKAEADDYSISAQIERWQVTHLQCTPSMARMLLMNDEARLALGRVKHLFVGGEALPGALVADLGKVTRASVTNMYGPTETTIWSSTELAKPVEGTVGIGRPMANQTMYVLDAHREPVPLGAPGELYIGGLGVARGYFERPELTAERFVADPFAGTKDARMYRTGDLVRWSQEGRIEFLGRVDHQVKIRGYRIELGEIEARMAGFEGVREAVVIAREDTPGDKRLVGYFTVQPDASVEPQALAKALATALPEFMVPSHLVELAKLPLTPNAKIDRKALPRPDASQGRASRSREHVEASNDVEKQIADVWKRILGLAKVGTEDNFFELGGHSLLAVQAHREIKAATGKPLSITDIFRFPTIAGLAGFLGGAGDGEADKGLEESADRAAARRAAMQQRANVRRR
ncbi:MAG: LLM class flavin-dependent oxidoreductase [Deltaproteobacteria bacterium]|nr:LLM class flavin-dependent oxidoreductase [Deltaproteobacteria bacterium]